MGKLNAVPNKFRESILDELDGRFKYTQQLRQSLSELMQDLGGSERLSYQQRSLCKRAVFIEFTLQQIETDLAKGNDADLGRYAQSTNALLGLFKVLGLERIAKDAQSLAEYLRRDEDFQR